MAKRQTFYTRADLFDVNVSPRAKFVLTYLSSISDREGKSFPSVSTIAEKCGCCPNSARKALRELEAAGFLSITARDLPTKKGHVRHTSHIYTLLFVPAKNEAPLLQPVQEGTSSGEGPSYNREIKTDVPYGHSQSVQDMTDRDPDPDRSDKGLSAILSRLQLDLFWDKSFSKSVRHALRRMYHSESIRVDGTIIPRADVRSAMALLTIDHVDFVERQLREATSQVTCGERYLMSCLYNAPLDCMAKSRCG